MSTGDIDPVKGGETKVSHLACHEVRALGFVGTRALPHGGAWKLEFFRDNTARVNRCDLDSAVKHGLFQPDASGLQGRSPPVECHYSMLGLADGSKLPLVLIIG